MKTRHLKKRIGEELSTPSLDKLEKDYSIVYNTLAPPPPNKKRRNSELVQLEFLKIRETFWPIFLSFLKRIDG